MSRKRCLMPDTHTNNKPGPADQISACNEESQLELELHLQRQLEDDVASDVYTECNIQHEEKEIIKYLQRNLSALKPVSVKSSKIKEEGEEPEVFSTPKCITPYVDSDTQKVIQSSPSTELTKEYYALVPIEGNLFEKELIEQDELSNAFHSIIKGQTEDKKLQINKPTSLPLNSSHTSKTVKHSSSYNILNNICLKDKTSPKLEHNLNTAADNDFKSNQALLPSDTAGRNTCTKNKSNSLDAAYSPDSLITDEPSSSSDYLSAAYTFSPGVNTSGFQHQVNVENITSKMENIYTWSDSGLEDPAMLGSVNSQKDVTLTNVSLSESTVHDLVADDASISAISVPSSLPENHLQKSKQSGTSLDQDCNGQSSIPELCGKSLKEEKQRQNEEIVILESSSLSSETGSWESVYPPKLVQKEICERFLLNERQNYFNSSGLVQKSPFKSTTCFIDASSLVDEDECLELETTTNASSTNIKLDILPPPSKPVPCSTIKPDSSPVDWSESNDNDDSLEQGEKKDPDSIIKDLSPTIFEMTPITEDSLCTNAFENAAQSDVVAEVEENVKYLPDKEKLRSAVFMPCFSTSTPNNSILSVKTFKTYESEDSESNTIIDSDGSMNIRKGSRSPPILSGGVSVEDHLPQVGNNHEGNQSLKSKQSETYVVTGKQSSSSAWVVDMSSNLEAEDNSTAKGKSSDESVNEKKNIFSMYIDLGDNSTLRDMPSRLSASMKRSTANVENKLAPQKSKITEKSPRDKDSIFEKYEALCEDPNISISEIIAIPAKNEDVAKNGVDPCAEKTRKVNQLQTLEEVEKIPSPKEPLANSQDSSFVKLSDLDKPVQKTDMLVSIESKGVDVRMTRSIPDWGGQGFSTNSRSIEVITSFHSENALSLNRLFPHLKNEFSRSMPGSLSSRTRSPLRLGTSSTLGDGDEQGSDMSEISSMQSSNCRSGFGNSTTDSQTSNLIENCTSRLGQDLLRMFLEEIAPDVIVEVSGKRFKAHKCILSSRCQYFAGILSGGWVESLGNVIVLPPFSYNVVYFALCHIYSGLATIPDSVSIVELATIADMLGLEGLKEAIMFTLKAKYCHHFHKPCAVCIVGVLECFPLSAVYGLDDLYHKCIKWITKYFTKVWPTKAFATLPTDLLDKCFQHHTVNLTVDNVVDTVYGCGITTASLQNSKWSEAVARMCRRLISVAAHFAGPRLLAVYQAIPPLPNEAPQAAKQALDDFLAAAIEWAPPDEVCRAYGFLSALLKEMRNNQYSKPDLISNGTENRKSFGQNTLVYSQAGNWRMQCEGALVRASPRVVTTQAFKELPSELRKRLRELGCIKYGAHALPISSPTHQQERKVKSTTVAKNKSFSSSPRNIDIAHVRALFVPYSPKPMYPVGSVDTLKSNNDIRDSKKSIVSTNPPKVRTTKAQEERAKYNKIKNTKSQDKLNTKASSARAPSFERTKPRYLEIKSKDKKTSVVNKHLPKIESSSESSRNSSPIHLRNLRSSPQKGRRGEVVPQTMSQDSLATSSRPRTAEPSTDSLSESQTSNRYATYTKTKHTKGSVDSNKTYKSVEPTTAIANSNKIKTKIPVYLNHTAKSKGLENRFSKEQPKFSKQFPRNNVAPTRPSQDRKVPGSLMNATKSSSAKVVPKVVKEKELPKNNLSRSQRSGQTSRHQQPHQHEEKEPPVRDIPVMERSGTFLKDEPTFGDKLTNLDISQ
ncbi:hypothetical protein HF086_017963 [Spodoptera exigua]|uniref:BTB domain-containing protein n=1 Tax=Spodoptera exigua TaxID=7107 RepID=A0A922M0Z3_SPOEX|nr:hypothetical protein HF086_017963 [Spodoptera exigua]